MASDALFRMDVTVFGCSEMRKAVKGMFAGKNDPYVKLRLLVNNRRQAARISPVVGSSCRACKWSAPNGWQCTFDLLRRTDPDDSVVLSIEVVDKNRVRKDVVIGSAAIDVSRIPVGSNRSKIVLMHKEKRAGVLDVRLSPHRPLFADGVEASAEKAAAEAEAAEAAAAEAAAEAEAATTAAVEAAAAAEAPAPPPYIPPPPQHAWASRTVVVPPPYPAPFAPAPAAEDAEAAAEATAAAAAPPKVFSPAAADDEEEEWEGEAPVLEISRAWYGACDDVLFGERGADITEFVQSCVVGTQLRLNTACEPGYFLEAAGDDPAPGVIKIVAVEYKLGEMGGRVSTAAVAGQPVGIVIDASGARPLYSSEDRSVEVSRALYGTEAAIATGEGAVDITEHVQSHIVDGKLHMNEECEPCTYVAVAGDPAPGEVKVVAVDYTMAGMGGRLITRPMPGQAVGITIDYNGALLLHSEDEDGTTEGDELQIIRGWYGNTGNLWSADEGTDITAYLRDCAGFNQLVLNQGCEPMLFASLFGDPAPGVAKGLAVEYRLGNTGGTIVTDNVVNDCFGIVIDSTGARTLKAMPEDSLEIVRAWYGNPDTIWGSEQGMDITEFVQESVTDNQLRLNESCTPRFFCDNVGDDPAPGVCKVVAVEFKIGTIAGTIATETIPDEPMGILVDMFGARTITGSGALGGPVMDVIRAWYGDPARLFVDGGVDITEFARKDLADGEMRLNEECAERVYCDLFGDPAPGIAKVVAIEFAIDGECTMLVSPAIPNEPVGFVIDRSGGYVVTPS